MQSQQNNNKNLSKRLRGFVIGVIIVIIVNFIFTHFFYTPKLYLLSIQHKEILAKYEILEERIHATRSSVEEIKARDNELYRGIFGVDSLRIAQIYEPYPDSRYNFLPNDDYGLKMREAWSDLDMLAKGIYRNSISFDQLDLFIADKERVSAAIPAIWPINRSKFKGNISAFGMRLHPIYKRYILHKGVDLNCNKGDAIYVTANGVVEKSEMGYRRSGYGQMLLINHGYGYKTRYAHLSRRLVSVGDSVKRGDVIGEAGNTGGSTGVHIHYEVIYNNRPVNPINYFDRYMTNEEYEDITNRLIDANYEIIE
ncbi:MAG: M23 family metallopeptidase [Rikenellaceae bacterium]